MNCGSISCWISRVTRCSFLSGDRRDVGDENLPVVTGHHLPGDAPPSADNAGASIRYVVRFTGTCSPSVGPTIRL